MTSRWAMRRLPGRSAAIFLGYLGFIVGCTVGPTDFPIPPDAVVVRIFTEGQGALADPEAYQWHFRARGSADQKGVVSTPPEFNCAILGREWTLTVTSQDGDVLVPRALARADQFAAASTVDIMITRVNERITVSEGLPAWWPKDKPVPCGMPE